MNNFGMAGRGPDNVDLGYVIYSPAQNCYRYSMNVENMNNGDYIRALRPPVLPFRPEERNEEEKEPKHMLDASLVDESSNLFESSAMYDCSFRVRNKSSERVVRCHKFILCISSKVFQAMFRGDFSEAGKGPADEILIDDTNPDVFEEAMRFVYTFGQKKSFENIPKTAEMYVFADKWQFTSLKEAADSFLISMKLTLENVAFMYGIFKMINHKVGMQNCMRMILANTLNFLESEQWKTASLDLVDAVLIQDYLSIASECDLLKGLIEWGAANVPPTELNENGQPTDSQVREAISKPLEKIRFLAMKEQHFTKLCIDSKVKIFSDSEMWQILEGIICKSAEKLPENFSSEILQRFMVTDLLFADFEGSSMNYFNPVDAYSFVFSTNRTIRFIGLKLKPVQFVTACHSFQAEFKITGLQQETIYEGSTEDYDGILNFYKARIPIVLDANINYKLSVKYLNPSGSSSYRILAQYLPDSVSVDYPLRVKFRGGDRNHTGVSSLVILNMPN